MYMTVTIISLILMVVQCEELTMVSKIRTSYLENYSGYRNVLIMHFNVPTDVSFASFRFQADQVRYSIFGCTPDEVVLYMKHGSMPVINPDGSKIPENFYNGTRSNLTNLEFLSDNTYHYINMTSPSPGSYFVAAFHPFVNPRDEGITQDGLTPQCSTYVDAVMYVLRSQVVDVGRNVDIKVELTSSQQQLYKFYVPEDIDHILITIKSIEFCVQCTLLSVQIQVDSLPSADRSITTLHIDEDTYDNKSIFHHMWVQENSWYYLNFSFNATVDEDSDVGSLIFHVKAFTSVILNDDNDRRGTKTIQVDSNATEIDIFKTAKFKKHRDNRSVMYLPYNQYNLVRDGKTDSFLYAFEMRQWTDKSLPIAVNLTSEEFSVLRFHINDATDVGGTFQFILAFKPRVTNTGGSLIKESEPENHTVVTCLRNNGIREVPTWPNMCSNYEEHVPATIILNKTITNATVQIPYPEAGTWFASLRLFCGNCEPCNCSDVCKKDFRVCYENCERNCTDPLCDTCMDRCSERIIEKDDCTSCDCDGNCLRTGSTCNTSVLFDLSSYPCVSGGCGRNGRCVFMVAEGFVYSTCVCTNNYKGWDCSDDSEATSFSMILLELLLLVLSNIPFVPATYIAYRRHYYVEAIVYFSTFFFSSFYHACDAGENIISFCIVRLSVLQFSDFFCGLLAIWVTIIAMAYLPTPWPSLLHMLGSILLAFGTTYNKTSVWVFVIPTVIGVVIMIGHWVWKYRQTKRLFPRKFYLTRIFPIGLIFVLVGLVVFAVLQTQSNYKYLHSLWHVLMAVAIIILLPYKPTFLPVTYL